MGIEYVFLSLISGALIGIGMFFSAYLYVNESRGTGLLVLTVCTAAEIIIGIVLPTIWVYLMLGVTFILVLTGLLYKLYKYQKNPSKKFPYYNWAFFCAICLIIENVIWNL